MIVLCSVSRLGRLGPCLVLLGERRVSSNKTERTSHETPDIILCMSNVYARYISKYSQSPPNPQNLYPYQHLTTSRHILSSLQCDLVFNQAFLSSIDSLSLTAPPGTATPRSTHSRLPISDRRDNARAKAKRSSSPLKIEEFLSACTDMPRSSMRLRIASEMSEWSSVALMLLPSPLPLLSREFLTSASERKMFERGTSVVRTSFACFCLFLASDY